LLEKGERSALLEEEESKKDGGNGERNKERDINNGIPFSMLRQDRRFSLLSKRSLDIST
jgi:hypothetical protein